MEDKAISDLLYGHLQRVSNWNEGEDFRYVEKKQINMSILCSHFGCSRQTLSKQLKTLMKGGFVVENGKYFQLPNAGKYYYLIDYDTLGYLLDVRGANVIKAYCYIGNLFRANGTDAFVTQNSLITAIGYDKKRTANHDMIRNILFALEQDGLVKFNIEYLVDGSTTLKIHRIVEFNKEVKGLKEYKC